MRIHLRPALAAVLSFVVLHASPAALAAPGSALAEKLSSGERSAADKARDAGRRPAEVLAFLGVEPGMTVVDLIAAGGWYTEVLSAAVGPQGKVHAQNNAYVLQFRDGANEKAITARLAGGRLPNVERLDREVSDLGVAPGSIDLALTALNFHDVYHGRGKDAAAGFLAAVHAILRPGGVLGIIDHVGQPGADNEKLHRIDPARVEEVIEGSGFVLEARSDALANPADDLSRMVFDESVRGKTARFVFRLRKPADAS